MLHKQLQITQAARGSFLMREKLVKGAATDGERELLWFSLILTNKDYGLFSFLADYCLNATRTWVL